VKHIRMLGGHTERRFSHFRRERQRKYSRSSILTPGVVCARPASILETLVSGRMTEVMLCHVRV